MNLQRLGDDERRQLLEVADDVVGDGGRALAVAAYGSKVAGYARPDSDYDLIVVAKKFKGRIRYQYVHSPVTSAALVVEAELLERDAVKAYLGEFVSGRLLNIYEPLLNGDLIRKAEVESKKRVLAEEILEIESQLRGVRAGPRHPPRVLPLQQAPQEGDHLPARALQLHQDLHLPFRGREQGVHPGGVRGGGALPPVERDTAGSSRRAAHPTSGYRGGARRAGRSRASSPCSTSRRGG